MNTASLSVTTFEKPFWVPSVLHKYHENITENQAKICYTNESIIAGLKARERLIINYIYKQSFRQIKFLVTTNSGTQMDAEDVFQDAMVIIYKKISTNDLKLTSSFETYLYSICRHLWLQKLNKHKFNNEYNILSDPDKLEDNNNLEELIEESEKYKFFQQHFLKLSVNDQKVLTLYMKKNSLKEVAHIMGYKSYKYAKHRKFVSKERLKNSILNDPLYQEIFQNERLNPVFCN